MFFHGERDLIFVPDRPSTSVPPTAELNSYIKITLLILCTEQSFSVAQVFTGSEN